LPRWSGLGYVESDMGAVTLKPCSEKRPIGGSAVVGVVVREVEVYMKISWLIPCDAPTRILEPRERVHTVLLREAAHVAVKAV